MPVLSVIRDSLSKKKQKDPDLTNTFTELYVQSHRDIQILETSQKRHSYILRVLHAKSKVTEPQTTEETCSPQENSKKTELKLNKFFITGPQSNLLVLVFSVYLDLKLAFSLRFYWFLILVQYMYLDISERYPKNVQDL